MIKKLRSVDDIIEEEGIEKKELVTELCQINDSYNSDISNLNDEIRDIKSEISHIECKKDEVKRIIKKLESDNL